VDQQFFDSACRHLNDMWSHMPRRIIKKHSGNIAT